MGIPINCYVSSLICNMFMINTRWKKNGEASKVIHVKEDNLHIKTKSLFELGILTPGRKIQK